MATDYTAEKNQVVPFDITTGSVNIYAPANAVDGHWFGVKNVNGSPDIGSGNICTVYGNGKEIEDIEGRGYQSSYTDTGLNWEFQYWTLMNNKWSITQRGRPFPVPAPYVYRGGDIGPLLPTYTQIPVAFESVFQPNGIYFNSVGGNLECIRNFAGYLVCTLFYYHLAGSNNVQGSVIATLNVIAGTANIVQGYGIVSSMFSGRNGTFPQMKQLEVIVVANVGAVIEWRASDDISDTMDTFIVEPSNIMVKPI